MQHASGIAIAIAIATTGIASTTMPATAQVQQTGLQQTGTSPESQMPRTEPAGQVQPAPADDTSLADIVVTAQRREANFQSVPVSVTTIEAGAAQAIGIKSTTDIQAAAPSIKWGSSIGGANISIRGISGTGSAGDKSANAVYVDGVYNPVGASLLFSLNSIKRIEIDKGPQGTLFGRNASGGAVQIFTRDPA